MSYHRKRHASMMESQKKAAEAEAAESMLAAVVAASAPSSSSSSNSAEVEIEIAPPIEAPATHAPATATVQHDDFGDDSSDDSESGIAFLSATVGGPGKKARGPSKDKAAKGQKGSTAAAAAAVMSLQRMHWTKEMVRVLFMLLYLLYMLFLTLFHWLGLLINLLTVSSQRIYLTFSSSQLLLSLPGRAAAAHCAHLRRQGLGQHRQAHG